MNCKLLIGGCFCQSKACWTKIGLPSLPNTYDLVSEAETKSGLGQLTLGFLPETPAPAEAGAAFAFTSRPRFWEPNLRVFTASDFPSPPGADAAAFACLGDYPIPVLGR